MRTMILFGLSLFSLNAHAAPHGELSVEVGSIENYDRSYEVFNWGVTMPSQGVRAGIKFHDRFTAVGSWNHTAVGATVTTREGEYSNSFESGLFMETFFVGVKADLNVRGFFYPYATAQVATAFTTMLLDDDINVNGNVGEIRSNGIMPGIHGSIGAELRTPEGFIPGGLQVALYLDVGLTHLAKASFEPLGDMSAGGNTVRAGLGVRF